MCDLTFNARKSSKVSAINAIFLENPIADISFFLTEVFCIKCKLLV